MKKILLLLLLFVGAKLSAQVPFELGAVKVDSVYISGIWIDSVSTDGTMAKVDDKKLVTSKALKTFLTDSVASWIDSISNVAAIQDSLNNHTDSLQRHNVRLKALTLVKHTHTNSSILNATTASFTTTISSAVSTATSTNTTQGDTLVAHNTRIKAVYTKNKVQDDTLVVHDTRINDVVDDLSHMKDSVEFQVIVDNDTLPSANFPTGNIFVIGRRMSGYVLTEATIYTPSPGDGVAYAAVYRTRSASSVNMVSNPASVTSSTNTSATINTSNDDVLEGDWIEIQYYDTGSPVSEILNIILIFKKP
jgi:hypothetical protein